MTAPAAPRFGRIVLTAVAIEVASIVALVALVALAGPDERGAAQVFAQRLGLWFGPLCGALLCFGGGYRLGRQAPRPVRTGATLGLVVAAIDVTLLVAGGVGFAAVFVLSNALRVGCGAAGGWVAGRRFAGG